MDKRHFTVVIGNKEHGLYISSTPSSAAKKAVSKLCASNKSKKVEFYLREITQGSKKKTYGPYLGEMKKLKTPIELKGRVIRYEIKVHLKKKSTIKIVKKMRGGNRIVNINDLRDFVCLPKSGYVLPNRFRRENIRGNANKPINELIDTGKINFCDIAYDNERKIQLVIFFNPEIYYPFDEKQDLSYYYQYVAYIGKENIFSSLSIKFKKREGKLIKNISINDISIENLKILKEFISGLSYPDYKKTYEEFLQKSLQSHKIFL